LSPLLLLLSLLFLSNASSSIDDQNQKVTKVTKRPFKFWMKKGEGILGWGFEWIYLAKRDHKEIHIWIGS
jgi:hypothetical protein